MKNYTKILRFLKPYWFLALLAPLFLIVEVYVNLLIPETMSYIVDIGVKNNDLQAIMNYSLYMLLYTFLGVLFAFLSNFFATWSSAEMIHNMRVATFKKSLNMSFTNLDEFESGKIITRVTADSNSIRWITKTLLRTVFRAPFLLIGSILMAIKVSPNLSMILVIIIPLIFITNYLIVIKAYPKYKIVQDKLEYVNTVTQENLENIRVVKAFNRSEFENEKFDKSIDDLMNTTIKASIITSISSPILGVIINASTVAVLYYGGLDVILHNFDIGKIFAFIQYLAQVAGALGLFTSMINMFPRVEACSTRVLELLNSDSEIKNPDNPITDVTINGKIEFKNVSFNYKNGPTVLNNLSFVVNPKERLGIIGTTGSGKTTIVNLISRFYDVTNGEILLDDQNIKDYDLYLLRRNISTVMQKALLFSGTIEDNIRFGAMGASDDEINNAAKNAQAEEFIENAPNKYNTILGERGINLSGGQKQRLSMARSLITQPKILIFDDSTSAVDMTTEAKILASLNENIKDSTIIIIAQRIRSIINADKIIVLENGTISGVGNHEQLLKTNKLYKKIYAAQIGGDLDEQETNE